MNREIASSSASTNKRHLPLYHIFALIAVAVWGLTFVSTKVLINTGLTPVQIFIIRFAVAYLCTLPFSHDRLWAANPRDELLLLFAGVTGGSLYFITENTALGLTYASNVALIIACAPIFTIILGTLILGDKLKPSVWIGSAIAFIGVGIVELHGSDEFGINPRGDLLTVVAALSWAAYCLLLKSLTSRYNDMFITRKVFAYGVITALIYYFFISLPSLLSTDAATSSLLISAPEAIEHIPNSASSTSAIEQSIISDSSFNIDLLLIIGNLAFLSIGASFLCYFLWNAVIRKLGPEKSSNYTYVVPLIAVIASTLILGETFTLAMGLGTLLIITGVILSTKR